MSNYKGFPKKRNYPDGFSFITFSCSGFVSRRGSMKKMADCETTTGHVGHVARTLMKDARRGVSVMETQLDYLEFVAVNPIHHAVLIRDPA